MGKLRFVLLLMLLIGGCYLFREDIIAFSMALAENSQVLMDTLVLGEGQVLAEEEQEMLEHINNERMDQGRSVLTREEHLVELARLLGKKMLNREGMDYSQRELEELGEELLEQGFDFVSIAVNLATGLQGKEVHQQLMESPENRDILLNAFFTHVGVGVVTSAKYGKVWVQIFVQEVDKSAEVDEEDEKTMFLLVNRERRSHGLSPLKLDEKLVELARLKSRDIVENNYFSHQSPTYGSPFEMLETFGIRYRMAAENLAGHQTVELAHEGLMNSENHRMNILTPGFTHIGIGVVRGSRYGKVYTQLFVQKR
ncbi:MAG: CAP domain-containing protein [Clostridia bacterium]|jgi:uncharacterized YkwD family protein